MANERPVEVGLSLDLIYLNIRMRADREPLQANQLCKPNTDKSLAPV